MKNLIVLCLLISPLWAGWIMLNSGTERTLNDVYFPANPDTGFVVGDSGTILRTTNGGATWVKLNSGVSDTLYSINFPKDNITGYAVGSNGRILKTIDMGNNWVPIHQDTFSLYTVQFPVDAETGYAAGGKHLDYKPWYQNVILKTTDGGKNWRTIYPDTSLQLYIVYAICFPKNNKIGYASGLETIIKTTDGGESWKQVLNTYNAFDICFPQDTLTGFVADSRADELFDWVHVARTVDAGNIWQWQDTGFKESEIGQAWSIYFPTGSDTGFVAGGFREATGYVLKTADGGNTWVLSFSTDIGELRSIYFPHSNQVGYAVGWHGEIYKTTNGGAGVTEKITRTPEPEFIRIFPNPFALRTMIGYSLSVSAPIALEIFDLSGKLITTLFKGNQTAGPHAVYWSGLDGQGIKLPAGVYFIQLGIRNSGSDKIISKKIVKLR